MHSTFVSIQLSTHKLVPSDVDRSAFAILIRPVGARFHLIPERLDIRFHTGIVVVRILKTIRLSISIAQVRPGSGVGDESSLGISHGILYYLIQ